MVGPAPPDRSPLSGNATFHSEGRAVLKCAEAKSWLSGQVLMKAYRNLYFGVTVHWARIRTQMRKLSEALFIE